MALMDFVNSNSEKIMEGNKNDKNPRNQAWKGKTASLPYRIEGQEYHALRSGVRFSDEFFAWSPREKSAKNPGNTGEIIFVE
jgi:hypothetical protein